MPRLRAPEVVEAIPDGVPEALLDADDPTWQSKKATAAWLKLHDLPAIGGAIEWGPINRRRGAAEAWARKAGLTKANKSDTFLSLDFERCRQLGLPAFAGGGAGQERLRYVATIYGPP